MGFTIEDALIQNQEQYQLKLLAGHGGCSNTISWVHMIEDTTIIQQLWGKELAVTTGLGFQSHDALFEFIKCLIKYHSVGLVINTGKYIFDIPQDIIDYCNEQDFPLLTTPWEVHMADLIKDFSMRCLYSQKEDNEISKLFQKAFSMPQLIEEIRQQLMGAFDVDGSFQVVLIGIEDSDQFDAIERRRVAFQLELCFEKIESSYAFFWFDGYFVLIVNNLDSEILESIIDKMYKRTKKRMPSRFIHLGIGTQMHDLHQVILSYKRAKAAVTMAEQFKYPMVLFEEMGVYQILFSIEDKRILIEMYQKLLQPLIDYDQKHHGELEHTLYYYLLYDGSQVAMAKNLYMHRNTINYRMIKIKELLNCQLETFDEKMSYMLALYIKKMLDASKD
ncbi:PucR family transcriptional regulator [Thomasclavelia cocleata]|nr:PucR family transcriptional regulator [Thomasclavelia cocleata]MCI9130566.1 PucR family transcriptional regulator [Thomasclavelia cocleata]MCI9629532.1 PucR family transcriptional regulator [Thomasclavelia cocleata]